MIEKLFSQCDFFQKFASSKDATKLDPKANIRNRGKCVFPAGEGKNKSQKDHFPINDISQARNALARASGLTKAPDWFKGSLKDLVLSVTRKVHSEYPSIAITSKSKKPGKT
jgi:hypothetical protein